MMIPYVSNLLECEDRLTTRPTASVRQFSTPAGLRQRSVELPAEFGFGS